MARSTDSQLRDAKLIGSARALHDVVRSEQHRSDYARKDWPELWERIDRIIELAASPRSRRREPAGRELPRPPSG